MKPHYILTSHGPLLVGVKRSAADVADIAQKRILVEQRRAEEDRRLADYANTLTPSARAHLHTDLVIAQALEYRTHMPKGLIAPSRSRKAISQSTTGAAA